MSVTPIQNELMIERVSPAVQQRAASAGAGSFFNQLERLVASDDTEAVERQVRDSAEKMIAGMFIEPVLKQLRNGPFKTEMFSGGMGEEVFGAQLDTELSMRMARSANWPLVDSLVDELMGKYREARGQAEPQKMHGWELDLHG
ncbi:hypothetical protein [Mucisphaera sp.]|uniref:hypothetical protein n=1 Tax=Mucisphaera sp. TaxID=2913024 RepID=UPI003D0977B0